VNWRVVLSENESPLQKNRESQDGHCLYYKSIVWVPAASLYGGKSGGNLKNPETALRKGHVGNCLRLNGEGRSDGQSNDSGYH